MKVTEPVSVPVYMAQRLLLLALIILFLTFAQPILIPLIISVLITFILLPVSQRLERFGIPRWIAIFISILLAIIVFGGLIYFLFLQFQSFGDDFPELKLQISKKMDTLQQYIREQFHVSKKDQSKWLDKKVAGMMDQADTFLITVFTTTGIFITNLILIPLYIYFITLYRDKVRKFILLLSHNGEHKQAIDIIHEISLLTQKYLKGLLIDGTIVAVIASTAYSLLHVQHAILFGLLVAILNIVIPYMGVTIGSILPFMMSMITQDSFGAAFGVVGISILIQFIDNHFINPFVVGSSVSINPLTALIALVISALIWGVYGMLICIPITGMIKVICDRVESLKPYGYIIGHETDYGQAKKKLYHRMMEKKNKK